MVQNCPEIVPKIVFKLLPKIVHPVLDTEYVMEEIDQWLPRFHCVVIGKAFKREV